MKFSSGDVKNRLAPAHKDLLLLSALSVVVLALSLYFDAFDRFVHWYVNQPEPWELEELVVVVVVLSLGFGIFAYRRWKDLDREVKERQRIEDALREQSESLKTLMDTVPNPIFYNDAGGNYAGCNKAFEKFTGKLRQDILGKNVEELWTSGEVANGLTASHGELFGNDRRSREGVVRNKEGEPRNVLFHSATIANREGIVAGSIGVITDITERKRSEAALVEEAIRRRILFERSRDGVVILDQHGKVYEANQRFADMLGYSLEEVHRLEIWDWDAQWTREELLERIQLIDSAGERFETCYRRKDGTFYDVEISANEAVIAGQRLIFCVQRDITERKRFEDALRDSEKQLRREQALLRALIDSIPDLIFFKDKESVYLGCNKAFEVYSGMQEHGLIGRTDLEMAPREIAEFYRQMDREMFSSGKARRNEEWIPFQDGGGGYFDTLKTPYYGPDGELLGLIGVSRDITERKRMAEALEKRIIALTRPLDAADSIEFEDLFDLEQIQKLQDQFAKASGVASLITHVDGTPITKPSGFCRLCEAVIRRTEKGLKNCYYSDSVIGRHNSSGPIIQPCLSGGLWDAGASITVGGRHIANWLIGQVRDETQEEARMLAYAKEIGADEQAFMDAFNEVPSMSKHQFEKVAQVLFTLAGQLSSMAYQNIQQARFIAERKHAEEERARIEGELRQVQKMEAIGTLAGGIAHDFNNILAVISGYTEMAQWDTDETSPTWDKLLEVRNATKRAKELVQQILAFSRKSEQEKQPVQVGLLVKEASKMLRASLPSTIEIKVNVASDEIVLTNATQFQQVLMNLCTNAAHAMQEEGGVLDVSLTDVQLEPESMPLQSGLKPGAYLKLVVKDTGHGIDPAVMDRIFDPFFTTKEVGVGTGLGLSVVHGIIQGHGGAIEVECGPEKGTRFTVLLPACERTSTPKTVEDAPLPHGRERILIVDDEPALLKVTKQMLERLGYVVEYRTNGIDALEALRHRSNDKPFDLVITDMTMPRMTGADLARELRQVQPDLPLILLTGFSQKIDEEKAKSLGIQGFLMKPVVMKDLANLVRKVLDGKV